MICYKLSTFLTKHNCKKNVSYKAVMLDGDDTDSIETGESYFLTAGAAYGDGAYVWMAQAKVKAAPSHRVKRKLFPFPHELQKKHKNHIC